MVFLVLKKFYITLFYNDLMAIQKKSQQTQNTGYRNEGSIPFTRSNLDFSWSSLEAGFSLLYGRCAGATPR